METNTLNYEKTKAIQSTKRSNQIEQKRLVDISSIKIYKKIIVMSEKDVLKRFWISIASGIVLLLLSGVGSVFYAKAQTAQNTKDITKLQSKEISFFTRDEADRRYEVIIKDIDENHRDIKKFNTKVDEIKDLILELHTK